MADALKQINSPLAKLNSIGQLVCILCNAPVKSAKVWTAHVNGREHRKNAIALKNGASTQSSPASSAKRKLPDAAADEAKKPKCAMQPTTSNGDAVPGDFFDDVNHPVAAAQHQQTADQTTTENGQAEASDSKSQSANTTAASGGHKPAPLQVPEGFFDDKLTDRRRRGVDERDPIEIEYEKFQKEMKVVDQVNAVIEDEEDEAEDIQKTVEQIDAQMEHWRRLNQLEIKREQLDTADGDDDDKKQETSAEPMDEQESSDDDDDNADLDTIVNWRAKNV